MAVLWSILRFLYLGAINHQMTLIVVESLLFRGIRERVAAHSRWLGELVSCHVCFGMWVAFLLALIFRPRFVDVPPLQGVSPALNRRYRAVATFAGDSFAIAVGGRIYNELLGLLRREVAVTEEERELLQEEVEQLERMGRDG